VLDTLEIHIVTTHCFHSYVMVGGDILVLHDTIMDRDM
jgi:hypothetical protein